MPGVRLLLRVIPNYLTRKVTSICVKKDEERLFWCPIFLEVSRLSPKGSTQYKGNVYRSVCLGRKPVLLFLSPGQISDYKGTAQFLDKLPKGKELLADRGYDADWIRKALLEKGITPCVSFGRIQKTPIGLR